MNFSITSNDRAGFVPFLAKEPVVALIDSERVLTGFIEKITSKSDAGKHLINYKVIGKTADFVDSKLESREFNPPITFKKLIEKVLERCGYKIIPALPQSLMNNFDLNISENEIAVIDNGGALSAKPFSDKIVARDSETAANIIRRYAEKLQLVVSTDGNGNIVISKIGDEKANTIIRNVTPGSVIDLTDKNQNNVEDASFDLDLSHRYYEYTIKAQKKNKDGNITLHSGSAFDEQIRKSRKLVILGNVGMSDSECRKRAEWEVNVRKMKSFKYQVKLAGFRHRADKIMDNNFNKNPLWKPNQIVYVIDESHEIDQEMLITNVTYHQNLNDGSCSYLELIDSKAYQLSLDQPILKKLRKSAGDGFII